ncbi:MAG TPA: PatB family C-S lyase [Methylomirabilota bacterium]|jgi:cystathionine beta-lyase|nr:PatB family C-S lyase [Methylomirabilota bacterium]
MPYDFDRQIDRRPTESTKWHKFPPDVLPLWVADMDFPSPEVVTRALRERVEHGVFGYGVEQPEFHEVMCERLLKHRGWKVEPEALVLLPGVIPGFNVACRAFSAPGDGLLTLLPVYPPILRLPDNVGLTRDAVDLTRGSDGRYEVDEEAFERAITPRTRMFILCNPHNPVGRVFTREELGRMAEICLRRGLVICADEIHGDLIYQGHQHVAMASLHPEIEARTITLMAPSKTYNLAGLKCALAVIPNQALREKFIATRLDLVQSANILGYTAMLAAYRDGQPWLDELLRYLEANRDFLVQYVRAHLRGVEVGVPEGTYLAWLDCRRAGIPGHDPYTFFLEEARVGLNDGATFGRGGAGFVRLNFGCPRSMLTEGLERMRKALAG